MIFSEDIVIYISDKVLKGPTLDVFYLIFKSDGGISKIEVLRSYQTHMGVDTSSVKYRTTVDEAIAQLIGTTFVDSFKQGTSDVYFLTKNGELAAEMMGDLFERKPELLLTSKIVSKAGGESHE
ncbi:hypothetical protein ABHN11_24620 [Brevibacillus centrosporus]|uniref:hypothetical protein n=1 Tax=Brevibacillus centrosporus TaxID=54910 RepID=UPI003D1BF7B9